MTLDSAPGEEGGRTLFDCEHDDDPKVMPTPRLPWTDGGEKGGDVPVVKATLRIIHHPRRG